MKTIELEVSKRSNTGRGANVKLRKTGLTPAVVYGASKKNFPVQVSSKEINLFVRGHNENALITFKSSDKDINGMHVLLKDFERDIMTRNPLHVDFYEIDLKKHVRVSVPLHFVGKAAGAAKGGLVSPIVRELPIDCLPTQIPDFLEVDISALDVGDSIHVEEIKVPDGIKKIYTDNYTVVTCIVVKEEVIVAPTEATTLAEPEVIAKGKKDEEGAEGGEKAPAAGAKAADKKEAPAKK